jgi:hypothetical protein
VLIISRTRQLGASPKKADANCMRAKIVIDKFGTTRTGDTNEPPPGGVTARRSNRDFVVKLDADASYPALISLIRTLRAVDGDMTLADDTASPMSREELCLKLAHRAFAIIERQHEDLFMSDLEIFTPNISAIDLLPANLTRLAELNFNNLDAPTALMRASTAKIENLVSVGQNRSSKLCFMTIPEAIDWPADRPALEQPMEEVLSEPIFKWLSTAYEAALAIRAPLYQHGILKINAERRMPFQRVFNPIAPPGDRPTHFRVLTTAAVSGDTDQSFIII